MNSNQVCKWYAVCPMKRYYESGHLDKKWIENYCMKNGNQCVRFQLERNGCYHPDWMLPDGTIDPELKQI